MNKVVVVISIMMILLGAILLLLAGIFCYASVSTLDAPPELYSLQRRVMLTFLVLGLLFFVGGIVVLVKCFKKKNA